MLANTPNARCAPTFFSIVAALFFLCNPFLLFLFLISSRYTASHGYTIERGEKHIPHLKITLCMLRKFKKQRISNSNIFSEFSETKFGRNVLFERKSFDIIESNNFSSSWRSFGDFKLALF